MRDRVSAVVVGGLAFLSVLVPPVFAQDPIHKAGRGLANVATCWVELPRNLHLGLQEENPLLGVGKGLLKGTGLTATRLAVGAYETVTFFVPYPKNYASPYEGLELPDYPWEN